MEEALREHAAIVEFSQAALISMTLDGVVRSWNPGAEHLFGYTAQEAIGKPIAFLGDANRNSEQITLIEQAKNGKVAGPVGTVRLRQGDEVVDIELATMPMLAGAIQRSPHI